MLSDVLQRKQKQKILIRHKLWSIFEQYMNTVKKVSFFFTEMGYINKHKKTTTQ